MRILVIRAGQLGDTAYASSIIEPLRHRFGQDATIDWVAKTGMGYIFQSDPRINNIFQVKSRNLPLAFNLPKLKIIIESIKAPYDLAVNLESGTIFNGVMRLLKANKKIGMPYLSVTEPPDSHAVDNLKLIYQSFLEPADLEQATPSLIGINPKEVAAQFKLPPDYFVLVPANSHLGKSSSINHRAWPTEHWLQLLRFMSKAGLHGVIIGGKGETSYFDKFGDLPDNINSLVGRTNFPQLIGLIQGAQGVVSTDTGPAHIAAAVNTPIYALIGPTNYKRTGPYQTENNQVRVISTNVPCSPCYHSERLKNCSYNECMLNITPTMVVDTILADKGPGVRSSITKRASVASIKGDAALFDPV